MDAASSQPRIKQFIRKMKRHGRHVPKIINYGTPKKLANIMLAEWELRQQKTTLRCLPILLFHRCLQRLQPSLSVVPDRQYHDCPEAGNALA